MPVAQVAAKADVPPAQIVAGVAVAAVGAVTFEFTVTVIGVAVLLHAPLTQEP